MLPPSSQRKSSQREDFDLGLCASHHLKNNPPKGRIPKRWDKNPVQEILPEGRIINRVLLIEGYLHISTFYSEMESEVGEGGCHGTTSPLLFPAPPLLHLPLTPSDPICPPSTSS